jgi:hypothetical protein
MNQPHISPAASNLLKEIIEEQQMTVTPVMSRKPEFQELIRENLVNIWEDDFGHAHVQAGEQV